MKKRSKQFIIAVVAALFVAVIPAAVFAQDGPDTARDPVRTVMQALLNTAAEKLGISPDDLQQALRQHQTPAQLAGDAGVSSDELAAALQDTWNAQGKSVIASFVENGLPPKRGVLAKAKFRARKARLWTKTAVKTLDMKPVDFVKALRAGQTPAQIAEAHNSTGQALIDAIVAAEKVHLDKAVADGKLTQAQADAKLATITKTVTRWVEAGKLAMEKPLLRTLRTARQWTKLSAETLDMKPVDFVKALRAGQTPAQIAEAHNSTGQALIDAIVAAEKVHLDKAVADGKLTQAQADAKLATITKTVTRWTEKGLPHPRKAAP